MRRSILSSLVFIIAIAVFGKVEKSQSDSETQIIKNVQMLGYCLENIQRQYFPICLPSLSERLLQPAGSFPVDFSGFPDEVKKHFQGWIDQDFIVHYSVGLYEDFETGAVVMMDANSGRELFRAQRERSYDKYAMQRAFFGLGEKEMLANEFMRGIFLPSKIATIVDLVPTVFWDTYMQIEQERLADSIEVGSIGMAMMSAGTITNLQLSIENTTNAMVAVEVWWPSVFTNQVDLFAISDLSTQPLAWELVCTNISTTTNIMPFVWNDTETNWTRFYIAGNADLDSDADGTPDAHEILLYETDPADPSSGGTPPPPAPTNMPAKIMLSIKSYNPDVAYTLSLASVSNTHTVVSTGTQTVSNSFDVVKGQSCILSLTQSGFSQCGGEWGYVASVSGSGIVVSDPDGILGDQWQADIITGTDTATVHVVKIEIEEIDFQDSGTDNNYDCRNSDGTLLASDSYEIKINESQNYPTVYKMETHPKVELKLKLTPTLTTTVSDLLYSEGALGFGSRETPVSMDFIAGNATLALNSTSTVSSVVRAGTYYLQWRGGCKPLNTACKIYTVYDAPKCADALYTTNILNTCTTWADGCNKVDTSNDAKNIPRKVQIGAKAWHGVYGYKSTPDENITNPFTWIPANKGDCLTYANLMTKGLYVLGVDACTEKIFCKDADNKKHWFYTVGKTPFWVSKYGDADGDGIINKDEVGYPEVLEGIYVWGLASIYDDDWRKTNAPWGFHGACSSAGHWWEITFYSIPDHDTEAEMSKYPDGPIIKYPGHIFPGNNW